MRFRWIFFNFLKYFVLLVRGKVEKGLSSVFEVGV